MKRANKSAVVVGLAVSAGLLASMATPKAASAHILVKDEGEWVWVRYTLKGARGHLMRVRCNSVDAKRAFRFARQAAQRHERGTVRHNGLKGAR